MRPTFHVLSLSNRYDLWYHGGGAYEKSSFGYVGRPSFNNSGIANVVDTSADWQLTSKTTMTFYFAHAAGKVVVHSIYPQGPAANFGYSSYSGGFRGDALNVVMECRLRESIFRSVG